ncbi:MULTISPECIES: hypothetical protein [unclassified Micromonospora]|uniref:hypothetical protein n=1 Tax=unclassified Micromonospora TaxID=2617518 RepID=UPI001C5CED41|nr:hypothetical protein [Micromonospora sp. RL09-050-HVF-A]MBW4701229.1 hypothetical protein [Micromonospora sp. RL09-050-HVF-A]
MPPSDHPFQVWIATDDTQTVVALAPLKLSGASLRREWGNVTDLRAVPVASAGTNVVGLVVLAALVFLFTLGLCLWQAPIMVIFFLIALTVGIGLTVVLSKPAPARVVAPEIAKFPQIHRTIASIESRHAFFGLVELAERAGRTLPALSDVVDPVEGGQSLAEALWVGADVLSRRDHLRPPAPRSQQQPIPATGRAADALSAQREVARGRWAQVSSELGRLQTALELAAVAGENAEHDQDALVAGQEAYRELAELYDGGAEPTDDEHRQP